MNCIHFRVGIFVPSGTRPTIRLWRPVKLKALFSSLLYGVCSICWIFLHQLSIRNGFSECLLNLILLLLILPIPVWINDIHWIVFLRSIYTHSFSSFSDDRFPISLLWCFSDCGQLNPWNLWNLSGVVLWQARSIAWQWPSIYQRSDVNFDKNDFQILSIVSGESQRIFYFFTNLYLFKVNNRNNRRCEICSKFKNKHISHIVLVFFIVDFEQVNVIYVITETLGK